MISHRHLIFTFFVLLVYQNAFSQYDENRIVGGLSTVLISRTADYDLEQQYIITPGYYLGYENHFSIGHHHLTGDAYLDYTTFKYKDKQLATDEAGNAINPLEVIEREFNFSLGVLYNFNLRKLAIGLGVRFEANVFAKVVGKSDLLTYKETSINGRKSDIKIPLEVSYSFGKMIAMLRYERGLINRLGPKTNEIKEFDNLLRLGVKYGLF